MRSNAYCGNLLWQSSLTRQAPLPLGGVAPRRVADAAAWKMLGGMRLTICLRMGYTVFVASGGGVFIIL